MKTKFVTQFSDWKLVLPEKPKQKSLTVPDQSIPMRTLMERHTRGLPTGMPELKGWFTGDNVAPNIQDLNDVAELRTSLWDKHHFIVTKANEEKEAAQIAREEKMKELYEKHEAQMAKKAKKKPESEAEE